MFSKIISTGAYVPPYKLTNEELSQMVDTNDEWIVSHCGINERRIAKYETTSDMAAKAARNALENSGVSAADVDVIIGVTCTADYLTPSMACEVQGMIGADGAYCFDLNAACTGFIYALDTADALIQTGRGSTVLIVCSEETSKFVDYSDRGICILFGDGASAVILRASEEPGLYKSYLRSEGTGGAVLTIESLSPNRTFSPRAPTPRQTLAMNGRDVYRFAIRAMSDAVREILLRAGKMIDDIKMIIPHQANLRIISSVSEKIGAPMEKIFLNLQKYGNMSSVSVPMALHEALHEGKLLKGDTVLLVGFGGGLTYGSVLVTI